MKKVLNSIAVNVVKNIENFNKTIFLLKIILFCDEKVREKIDCNNRNAIIPRKLYSNYYKSHHNTITSKR